MNNKGSGLTPAQALDKLDALYEQSVVALRNAIGNYITSGELPDENARKQGLFVYPSLTVTWDGSTTNPPKTRAFGRFYSRRQLHHHDYSPYSLSFVSQ
ncbi:AMP nucleosidase [Escherichia coli]|uniref:AMP nucleosidase n=1 Tax=Escherichia coli TaxID=562 RepID=A0A376U7L7_ECOLX|nr:AMP nucleosidase [Escherichia coli]